ncbi:MAG: shikimate dehydrogenase [Alphaproteobacteria bacterium]|nr:shikimate dehydrogenase [Alphaproteobacteria bacterium]
MIKACVIGWPIAHSRSPLIHGYWLKTYGIEGSYTRIPVEPQNLRAFVEGLRANGFAGCNVTMPHKEEVFRLVKVADEQTRRLGSLNTVYVENGTLYGTSTDGLGFLANLKSTVPALNLRNRKVVLLGAGGSAAAIAGNLLAEGVAELCIVNRSLPRAQAIADRFGSGIRPVGWDRRSVELAEASLLINTTSLGMAGQAQLDISLAALPSGAVVADIVYTPLVTDFLMAAQAAGYPVVTGLGMLLHQAVPGFEKWFGRRPVVTRELYELTARDIDPTYRP